MGYSARAILEGPGRPDSLANSPDWVNHDNQATGGGMAEEASQRGTALLIEFAPPGSGRTVSAQRILPAVSFDRRELTAILNLYGRMVAAGEWRDYAMDFLRERAVFSVFKRASERPLYIIEKQPKLRAKQGQYMVLSQEGRVLRRGHDLDAVLRILERKPALVT
jgi:hypothetical protein